jgi:uncharacterized protein YndB with AHSA1/START domain
MQMTSELAVRKSVTVATSPEHAFELFTDGVAGWWPIQTHSTAKENAETVVIEPHVGGRFYERTVDGDEHDWGTVTAWEPPGRFACSWHPGYDPSEAQDLEVRFLPEGDGTRVELVHTGWERRADGAEAAKDYGQGWEIVLGKFAAAG